MIPNNVVLIHGNTYACEKCGQLGRLDMTAGLMSWNSVFKVRDFNTKECFILCGNCQVIQSYEASPYQVYAKFYHQHSYWVPRDEWYNGGEA